MKTKRLKRSHWFRGSSAMATILTAPLWMLAHIESELLAERACHRPRRAMISTLESRRAELCSRRDTLDEIAVLKFVNPITSAQACRYVAVAEKILMLDAAEGNCRAHPIDRAAAVIWLAGLPSAARVYAYTVSGNLWIGTPKPRGERRAA